MCIVIDINAIPSVFKCEANDHPEFRPVREWIIDGKGKMVYGGTKYKEELSKLKHYHNFIAELSRKGKIVMIDENKVDEEQQKIIQRTSNRKFNDPHLVAIIVASGCRLLCTNDKKLVPFIKDKKLYGNHASRPSIYSNSKNSRLLNDRNIADCCGPCSKGGKVLK